MLDWNGSFTNKKTKNQQTKKPTKVKKEKENWKDFQLLFRFFD